MMTLLYILYLLQFRRFCTKQTIHAYTKQFCNSWSARVFTYSVSKWMLLLVPSSFWYILEQMCKKANARCTLRNMTEHHDIYERTVIYRRITDRRQYHANSQSYCIAVRQQNKWFTLASLYKRRISTRDVPTIKFCQLKFSTLHFFYQLTGNF